MMDFALPREFLRPTTPTNQPGQIPGCLSTNLPGCLPPCVPVCVWKPPNSTPRVSRPSPLKRRCQACCARATPTRAFNKAPRHNRQQTTTAVETQRRCSGRCCTDPSAAPFECSCSPPEGLQETQGVRGCACGLLGLLGGAPCRQRDRERTEGWTGGVRDKRRWSVAFDASRHPYRQARRHRDVHKLKQQA